MAWFEGYGTPEYKARRKRYYEANKEKLRAYGRAYASKNREVIKEKMKARYQGKRFPKPPVDIRVQKRLYAAKASAAKRGLEFSLISSDITIPEVCPILGIPLLEPGEGVSPHNYASVDRLDNSKGYVPGNVWVISMRANSLKSDASSEELLAVARAVRMIEEKLKGL